MSTLDRQVLSRGGWRRPPHCSVEGARSTSPRCGWTCRAERPSRLLLPHTHTLSKGCLADRPRLELIALIKLHMETSKPVLKFMSPSQIKE